MNKWIEWKWSNGDNERYERSQRPQRPQLQSKDKQTNNKIDNINELNNNYENQVETQVVNQCLYSEDEDINFRDIGKQQQQQNNLVNEFQKQPNKREDTYNRMAEREMVGQRGMNPFFSQSNNNSYIDDLMNQENFMKPISTSIEREK